MIQISITELVSNQLRFFHKTTLCKSFTLIILFVLFQSCEKESIVSKPRSWKATQLYADYDFYNISTAKDNSIFVSGTKWISSKDGAVYVLIKSKDQGITWETVEIQTDSIYKKGGWSNMAFFNENEGIFTGYRTLFHTNDGGCNWDTTYLGYNNFSDITIHNDRVFGYVGQAFWFSDDIGANWEKIDTPQMVWAMSFVNENIGYASASSGFYITTNGGTNWRKLSVPVNSFKKVDFYDQQHGIATYGIPDPSPQAAPNVYLCITEDGGLTWRNLEMNSIDQPEIGLDISVLYKSLDEIYIATAQGIYLSTDQGNTWTLDYDNPEGWIWDIKSSGDRIIAVGRAGIIVCK